MSDTKAVAYWDRLRKSGGTDDSLEIASIASSIESGYGLVRFALGPSNEPRLLVPCAPATRLSRRSSEKLEVSLARLSLDGETSLFVDVKCLDLRLESVFGELTSEILTRIESGITPGKAVDSGIHDFRDLLREGTPEEVPDEIVAGLIGELIVLNRICREDPAAALTWTGPESERHDFRCGKHAFEVKTSTRTDRTIVGIHGIEQLSPPKEGTLVLFHIRIERTAEGPLTVERLINELMGLGVSADFLKKRLGEIGCDDHRAPEWNRRTFNLEGVIAYNVGGGFPRIVGTSFPDGQVPAGLTNITYDLDLQFAWAFMLDEDGTDAVIERFVA